jgi:hypothetical protein
LRKLEFRKKLFCQKRKLPPAGKALTPQTTEEPPKAPKQKTEKKASTVTEIHASRRHKKCRTESGI